MRRLTDHPLLLVGRYLPLVTLAVLFAFPVVFMVMSS